MKKTGIFGGSFNPVHTAHLILAELAADAACLDEVLFVPARIPPHKAPEKLAGAQDRLKMLKLATAGNPRFSVSELELQRNGPSYTLTTVTELQKIYARHSRLVLILGADSVRDMHQWYRAEELVERIEIIGLQRHGVETVDWESNRKVLGEETAEKLQNCLLPLPRIEISASDIREKVEKKQSIRYIVPEPVRDFIHKRKLYGRHNESQKS